MSERKPMMGRHLTVGRLTEDESELIRTVRSLIGGEGSPTRAFAEGIKYHMLESFKKGYDVDKVTSGRKCLKRLKNKHCTHPCSEHAIPGADHSDLWLRDGKPALATYHIYDIGWGKLQEIVDWCRERGYEASVVAWSWYFPTSTVMVVITRQDEDPYGGRP